MSRNVLGKDKINKNGGYFVVFVSKNEMSLNFALVISLLCVMIPPVRGLGFDYFSFN